MYRTVVGVVAAAKMAAAENATLETIVRQIGFDKMKKDIAGQKCEEGLCKHCFQRSTPLVKNAAVSVAFTDQVADACRSTGSHELWTRWVKEKWACWHEHENMMCKLCDWTWRLVLEVKNTSEFWQSSSEGKRSPWAVTSIADLAMWTIYDTFTTTGTVVNDLCILFRKIVNIVTILPYPPTPGYNANRIRNKDYTIRKHPVQGCYNKGIQMGEEQGRYAGEAYFNGSKMLKHGHFTT